MLIQIFENILFTSVMAAILIILICFAKLALKEKLSASWHYYIWVLLLLRLIIPYTPPCSIPGVTLDMNAVLKKTIASSDVHNKNIAPKDELQRKKDGALTQEESYQTLVNIEEYDYVQLPEDNRLYVRLRSMSYMDIGSILWILGMMVFGAYTIVIGAVMRYRIRKAAIVPCSDSLEHIVEECRKLIHIQRTIPVIYQRHIKSPALYGLIRPKLLIPADTLDYLSTEEIKHIVLHELCHYKRKDIAINMLLMVLNMIYWFNPLIWYAFKKINVDREPVCDGLALTYLQPGERKHYARTLVKILEIFSESYLVHSTASIFHGRTSNMEWRLRLIKGLRKKSIVLGVMTALIIAVLGGAGTALVRGSIGTAEAEQKVVNIGAPIVQLEAGRGKILDRNGNELVQRNANGKNYYPNKNLAAHVVGFTGENGKGVTGAEAMLDSSGTDNNITLTIDKNIQKVAEDALKKAMEDYKPRDGASAIIMDPATGEILAMVSMPDFDPNMPMTIPGGMDEGKWKGMTEIERKDYLSEKVLKNKTISETYEPASSFKTITAAAGLEEGIVKPDSPVDDTPVKVDQWTISCWTPKGHGKETFAEAVYNSCSPVFVRISQSLGTERFYRYLQSFGFMDKTNLGLPGEARSIFHTKPTNIDLATASFGQRVQVTPIQLTAAYGAIANGGRLLKPQIIREITDAKGQSVKRYEPEVIREVLSKQTSNALKEILEGSVSKGTGANAFMKGYRIAGKTGTAETPESKTKGIYIASFIGFAPADDPRIVCQVILNGPQVNENTGGMTAAPVSGKIMKDVLDYLAQ